MTITVRLAYQLNLRRGMQKVLLPLFASGDSLAHEVVLQCGANENVALNDARVSATFTRADGKTMNITGTVAQDKISVLLPQFCYAVPGRCLLTISLEQENQKVTVLYARGAVLTDTYNKPEQPTTNETALLGMAILGKMRLNYS